MKVTVTPMTPIKYYNYAMLHSLGISSIFDILRYDRAFFVRKKDIDEIISPNENVDFKLINKPFSILLCKYNWKKQANWTHNRLLSTQKLEELKPEQLHALNADQYLFGPPKSLKYFKELEFTGKISDIISTMYKEKACPFTETDSHKIADAFYTPDQEITINLATYRDKEY